MSDDLPIPDFDAEPLPPQPATGSDPSADAFDAARLAIEARNAAAPRRPTSAIREVLPAPSADQRAVLYENVPHPGFRARFGAAFVAPFAGAGILWLLAMAAAVFVAAMVTLSPKIFVIAIPATCALAAALQAVHFGQAANAGMHDEGTIRAEWAWPERDELSHLGLAFAFCGAALLAPAIAAVHIGKPLLALLSVIAFLTYWPMALIGVGISGSVLTLFRPILLLRMIGRTFGDYVRVIAVASALLLPPIALMLFGGGALQIIGALILGPALAYASGVTGFLMGCLAATRVEAFRLFRR